jgi:hypothetical protein
MTYLDKNQENNILNEVVVSKFEILPFLLDIIAKNPFIIQSDLKRKSKYSGGKIYHCVKAMKSMKLVENGNGLKITDVGKDFLLAYNSDKEKFKILLKKTSLNVPLFDKLYQKEKELIEPKKLFVSLQEEINGRYDNLDSKFLGAVIRRYLQGVHGIKLRVGFKVRPTENGLPQENASKIKKRNNKEIIEILQNLKRYLELSDKDFSQLLNSLPEKKREEIFSQMISTVFT